MKSKIQFIFIVLLTMTIFGYGQITVTIEDMSYVSTGDQITNCGTIDLESNDLVDLDFTVEISRAPGQVVADGRLHIITRRSGSDPQNIRIDRSVPSSDQWGGSIRFPLSLRLSASEFEENGGRLWARFNTSGVNHISCTYSIIKAPEPSFSISPESVSLACGDMSQRIFTITAQDIPQGSNETYQWSHPGWTLVSSTDNSRTLRPSSAGAFPGNVRVTAFIDGVAEATLVSTVNQIPFTTIASINGSSAFCQTATYTMNNLPSGVSVKSASSSNTSRATVNVESNGSITATKVSNGTFTLSVVLENACSETVTKTKNIQVGENVNVDVGGLENGIDAGGSVDLILTNANGCGVITFTDASSGLNFDYVGPDYAVLSSTPTNTGTGWVYISITGGTSIFKEFPINTASQPAPNLPDEDLISIARITNGYNVHPYSQWKMVKAYYYGNSSDVDYWEWDIGTSYYAKPSDSSIIFLPTSSSNETVRVRACNSDGCSQYVTTIIN